MALATQVRGQPGLYKPLYKKKTEQQNTQEMNKLAFLLFNTLLSWFDFYIKKKKTVLHCLPRGSWCAITLSRWLLLTPL